MKDTVKLRSGLFFFLFLSFAAFGQTLPQTVTGHVPAGAVHSRQTGVLADTNVLNLAIGLPLRNKAELNQLLQQIYDPASPNYHHYLTPAEFAARFGPSEQDYHAVAVFAESNGLKVNAPHSNRMIVDVSGSVKAVNRAFHVTMGTFKHPRENRIFYAPNREPSVNLSVRIAHVGGLDNYSLPRPQVKAVPMMFGHNASPADGSGPDGSLLGSDFRGAYVPGTSLNGAGQSVGLLQFDGYDSNDIVYYENLAGLPAVTVTNVLVDGASGTPSGGNGEVEVCLDIEMAMAMAPNLSRIIVYEAPNPSPFEDILNRMATDNLAKQLSCSWFIPNGVSNAVADQIFQQMAAQGQSFFTASGDSDAYTGLIGFPCDSPYITVVGGTTLATTGTNYSSESAWNWGSGSGTGGGISTQYPLPSWQTNISMVTNQGSTIHRNIPDVALTSDNIYVRAQGLDYNSGGTSAAAPLWAGFAALANQQAAIYGTASLGFVNPVVYAIGRSTNYSSAFHDITVGNNTSPSSPTKFYATNGFDLCTGWGTPRAGLIPFLSTPDALIIAPSNGFAASGAFGGPFTVTKQDFVLTNVGSTSLNWALANTSAWLSVSSSSGTLTPGGVSNLVTVSLNSVASNLVAGSYGATIRFTNVSDGIVQSRVFSLSIVDPPAITTQPTGLALPEGATASFSVTAAGGLPLAYQWRFNGTNLSNGGNVSGATTTNLVVTGVTTNNAGPYSVAVTNSAGIAISSNAFLTVTSSAPIIVVQPTNQSVFTGGTVIFTVSAIGTTPLSYQWRKGGTNVSGATGASLTITNAQAADAAVYSVLVTNIVGSTLSSNATLTLTVSCDPAPSGLVAWWKAENNATDSQGSNNGTPSNVSYTTGVVGQAFHLGGSMISIPDSPAFELTNALTVEAWIRPVSPGYVIFWRGDDRPGFDPFTLSMQGNNNINFSICDPNGVNAVAGTGINIPYSVWTHVAGVFDSVSGTVKLYTNGILADSVSTSIRPIGALTSSGPLVVIGAINSGGFSYQGDVDELSLYSRALSPAEIYSIYSAGSLGKCPPPPVIGTQPQSQIAYVGSTATFTVAASGAPPLFYQWSVNGTNLVNATNATLVLNNVQLSQSGTYRVQVGNLGGSVNSSNAVLTVLPVPPCDPAPSGIIAWWPAEGNAFDFIGTNTGTLFNGAGFASGEDGQAFSLDGVNDLVIFKGPGMNTESGTGFSLEGWINPTALAFNVVVAEYEQTLATFSGSDVGVQLGMDSTLGGPGSLVSNMKDTSQGDHAFNTPGGLLVTGVWQHVALTYDKASGTGSIYINGLVVTQVNLGSYTPLTHFTNLVLGGRTTFGSVSSPNNVFPGKLDEFAVYNRALSTNEIAAIYQAGISGKCVPPPTIVTQPQSQTVVVSNTATFTVAAAGVGPFFYQWSFNGTNIIGATSASLVLSNVQFSQAGNYRVQVANTGGSTNSSIAVLTVIPTPPCAFVLSGMVAWWAGESNALDNVGTNNATVVTAITYTNGEVQKAFVFDGSSSIITAPASSGLSVSNFTIEAWVNSADYNLGRPIVDYGDSTTGSPIQFWINTIGGSGVTPGALHAIAGSFEVDDSNLRVVTNQWVHIAWTYSIGASSSTGVLYCNGNPVATNTIGSASYPSSHYPVNIGYRTAGSPQLLAGRRFKGALDEVSIYNRVLSAAEIQSIYQAGSIGKCPPPPTIVTQPASRTVLVGDPVTFSVTATGTGPIFYQWSFNGSNIVGATSATLTLTNVQLSQAGNYQVQVGNLGGTVNSSNAVLTVLSSPVCASAPSGIIAWWAAEGNALDSVGTNNGTFVGGVVYTNGEVGQAFGLNGVDSYVSFGNPASLNVISNRMSIETWVKINSFTGPGWNVIIGKGDGAWQLRRYGSLTNVITFTTGIAGNNFELLSVRNIVDAQWHHVVGTYDGTNKCLYIDGTLDATAPQTGVIFQNSWPALIGENAETLSFSDRHLNGAVDEASLYSRALSATEVMNLYNARQVGKCALPPTILVQPANQAVAVGSTATFGVVAVGTPYLQYQWSFNGTNIANATNNPLVLTNVQASQSGSYAVQITNPAGITNSSAATLLVGFAPVITNQPVSLTNIVGTTATFTVGETGSPTLTNQWKKNGVNIQGATATNYVIASVQSTDAGTYSVAVTNAFGFAVSSNVTLTVLAPPFITNQPVGQAVIIGNSAAFSVGAGGTLPLAYQWTFNGANLLNATNASLPLSNVQSNQAGLYAVVITNNYGAITSSTAVLTVVDCSSLSSGLVGWWKGESNALDSAGTNNGTPSNVNYTPGMVGTAFRLLTSTIRVTDGPQFALTNAFSIEGWVRPNAAGWNILWRGDSRPGLDPYFLSMQGSSNILFGICDISGTSVTVGAGVNIPYNLWTHVAGTFDGTNGLLRLYTNGLLAAQVSTAIRPIGALDPTQSPQVVIGNISTGGFDFHGDLDEISLYSRPLSAAEISAIYKAGSLGQCPPPPTITLQPTNRSVVAGSGTTFVVAASGQGPLFYQWTLNGTNLLNATNATLALTNVQLSQAGTYAALVGNVSGTVNSSNAILTVLSSPIITSQPTNFTVLRSGAATFAVTAIGTAPLSYQWKFNGFNIANQTNTALNLANVQLNQAGNYTVFITNSLGSVLSSNAVLTVNPLFHFSWNSVPNNRFVNTPFVVIIRALNPTNGLDTNFVGSVSIITTNGIIINPAVSGGFVQGSWTGAVAATQTGTNVVLEAVDSFGETGFANAIRVVDFPQVGGVSSGSSFYVFWPTDPSGFVLETTPNLMPANWTTAPGSPILIGGQWMQPITISNTNAFFRLRYTGQ